MQLSRKANVVLIATLLSLSTVGAYAACVNNYLPQSYAELQSINPDGSKTYLLYRWDYDTGAFGKMAVYDSSGRMKAQSSQDYLYITQPKGAGYWHLDITDTNSCGALVRWLHSVVLYN